MSSIEIDEDELIDLLTGRHSRSILVGLLNDAQRQAIGAFSHTVWLSAYTARKIYAKHRDDTLGIYMLAPTILRIGESRRLNKEFRQLVFLYSRYTEIQRPYRAVVKTTADGRENFLLSVYRITKGQIGKTLGMSDSIKASRGGASR